MTVRYGDFTAVEEISFSIPEGASLSIVGPNGSGKTTIIKALLGVAVPASGTIEIFGGPPERSDPHCIGYMPQLKTLDRTFPAISIELVISGRHHGWPARISAADRAEAIAVLEKVDAVHLADRPIRSLSGGELQRVYLARCLIGAPRLILLDEPASGIDAVGEADLYDLLEQYLKENNATLIIVTHDWQVAFHHSSHVLIVDRRQIVFGSPAECLTEEYLRRAFGHIGHSHGFHTPEWK